MKDDQTQTPEELLEQEHNKYINQVTQSGMPLWYYELYNDSMYYSLHIDKNEELKENRISVNTPSYGEGDSLPF